MNPNQAFKQKNKELFIARDNGITYYMIRCSECHKERYVSAGTWHRGIKPRCPGGCIESEWVRI